MRVQGAFPVRWAPKDGEKGTGVTVKSTSIKYAAATQGTSHPTSGWQNNVPSVSEGNYLWTWTHIEYSDGTKTDAYSVARMGIDGKGIQNSKVTYSLQKNNVNPETINDWGAFPSTLTDGYWLYTKTHIVYSDNSATDSYSVAQVGVGSYYAGVAEYYKAGSDADNVPDGAPKSGTYANGQTIQTTWKQERPTLTEAEPYLWNFEISADSRGNKYVTDARCIGNFAKGITSIVEAYALSKFGNLGADGEPNTIGAWEDEPQDCAPTSDYPYQWNRTTVTYNNGDTDVTYHVSAVRGSDGKGAVYIDLDNENDTMLYNQAGTLLSGSCRSNISLYANGQKVTNPPTFSIQEKSASVSASISGSVLTVSGITSNSGYVIVRCTYQNVTYTARFTVKRLVGTDKYELSVNINSITLNVSSSTLSNNTIQVSVYRTGQNASRERLTSATAISNYGVRAMIYPNGISTNGVTLSFDSNGYTNYTLSEGNASAWNNFAVVLFKDYVEVDRETIPINKVQNGQQGQGGVVLDFDNENDSMLYDGAGNLLSGNVTSQGTLLEGGDDVTQDVTNWAIVETTGGVSASINQNGKVTITGISQTSGSVKIEATYNGDTYYCVITIKRLVGVDKYDIVCTPSAITYNQSTGSASSTSVKIEVYRTGQNGARTLVSSLNTYNLKLRYYADSGSAQTIANSRYNGGVSMTVYPSSYTQYRFELLDVNNKVLDSETVPISKTANGGSGRGITSQTSYFTATDKLELAKKTDISDEYWSTIFPTTQVTEQKPYVWKSVYTVYTSGNPSWSTPELVATYRAGANQNLLDNAAFRDDSHMDAWETKSQYSSANLKDSFTGSHIVTKGDNTLPSGKNNRHYYLDTNEYRQSEASYKECLRQVLFDTTTKKLQPNTWYTLSYWYKCGSNSKFINQTSNAYGFGTQLLYLQAGHKYRLHVGGYISQTASNKQRYLRIYIYRTNAGDNNWKWIDDRGCPYVDIKQVGTSQEKIITIGGSDCDFGEVPETAEYRFTAYLYPNDSDRSTVDYGTATLSFVRMHDLTVQADSYVYPSCVDTKSKAYVDGKEVATPSDMNCGMTGEQYNNGNDNQEWKRHIITFKTGAVSGTQYVLFRLLASPISGQKTFLSICMPKLEEGMFATGFMDTYEDTEGLQGCIMRDFIWQEGYECHNDEKLTTWPRYLDIAYIEESEGVWKVYQCLATHKASADRKPGTSGGASWWKEMDNMGPLYTPLLIAKNAKIKFGQTNQLIITNSQNKIQGCFGGVEDETNGFPLWIGGETADAAKFKVKYGGQLYATDAIIQGTIRAISGIIGGQQVWNYQTQQTEIQGGFNISGSGLTYIVDGAMNKKDMAYIICRNDYYGRFAGIGANVLPASSGSAAVARFENTDSHQWYGYNIAMILEAENGTYNMAFLGTGDGVLNGDIIGYKFQEITCIKDTLTELNLSKGSKVLFINNVSNSGITLPTLSNVRESLSIGTSTKFAFKMYFMQSDGDTTANVVYGRNKSIQNLIKSSSTGFYSSSDTSHRYSTYTIIEQDGIQATLSLSGSRVRKVKSGVSTYYNIGTDFRNYWMNDSKYPQIWDDDKNSVDCVSMGKGDTRCFMIVYNNGVYGAYMISKNY